MPVNGGPYAGGCKFGVLSAMGPIGPAAGPATSRRFLLGPINPWLPPLQLYPLAGKLADC